MKTRLIVLALGFLSLTSCYTSKSTTSRSLSSDDDIYYSKKTTEQNSNQESLSPSMNQAPAPQTPPPAPQSANSNQGNSRFYYDAPARQKQGQYQDSVPARDSIHYGANSNFSNQNQNGYYDDSEYDYSTRINHFYHPYYGFGYYDPFFSPYSYYAYDPFLFGWGIGFGWGFGWGYGWGFPGYYGGGYWGGGYHGGYWGGGYHGGFGNYGNRFTPGGNPYSPRRTLSGNLAGNIGYNAFSSRSALGVSNGRLNTTANSLSNSFRGNAGAFVNPNVNRATFNAPNRAGISNSFGNAGRISNNANGSRATGFRNPSLNGGNFNYSPSAASKPVASGVNRINSGTRSTYFNNNQRFGGFNQSGQISRSYSPPANNFNNNNRSFSAPQRSSSFNAPQRSSSSFSGGGRSSFGGGGGFGGGSRSGRH